MKKTINGNTQLGRACNRALTLGRASTAAAEAYAEARSIAVVEIAKANIVLRRGDALLLAQGEVTGRDKVSTSVNPADVEVALSDASIGVAEAIRRGILKVDLAALRKSNLDVQISEERDIGVPVFAPTPTADESANENNLEKALRESVRAAKRNTKTNVA